MMNKALLYISLILMTSLYSLDANAQLINNIQQAFNSYQQYHVIEKLYVHTDRDTYLSGELIWYKVYALDTRSDFSKVVYVDVLDNQNNFILQAKVSFEKGVGAGSFYLPKTIKSGVFKLRAYTNWMKNFGANTFFEKRLNFINLNGQQPIQTVTSNNYTLQFFPEGGDLINGLSSRVAFKVVGKDGKGMDLSGSIISDQNDTVAYFHTLKFGMGSFTFTPKANCSYKAISKSLAQDIVIKELPKAKSTGYVMNISRAVDEVHVKLITNTTASNAFLFVHNNKKSNLVEQLKLKDGMAELRISLDKLNDGISSFTVFNTEGKPVCERLFFKRPKHEATIHAEIDQSNYTSRRKVKLNLLAKNENGNALNANLSVSVFQLDLLNNVPETDIVSYLWLSSALNGSIESPSYYLQNDNPGANEALDNLLLSQGWSHFKWDEALTTQKPLLKFLPEINGHIITGAATKDGENLENKGVYIGIPGKKSQFYASKLNANGQFLINTKDFFGNKEMVLLPASEADSTLKIKILSPFSEQFTNNDDRFQLKESNLMDALKLRNLSVETQNAFVSKKLNTFADQYIDTTAFYSTPYKVYYLDLYTRFPTLKEVAIEFIAELRVTKHQKKSHLAMIGEYDYLNEDPLVLLDGVPFTNVDFILNSDPSKIKKLAIVNNRYYYGGLSMEGIVSLSTANGDLGGIAIDPHALVVDYEGLELQREFYSPTYDTNEQLKSRIPDFRNLLYWSPNVTLDSKSKTELNFYTSDQTGNYIVVIQGLTADGIPFSKNLTFSVAGR